MWPLLPFARSLATVATAVEAREATKGNLSWGGASKQAKALVLSISIFMGALLISPLFISLHSLKKATKFIKLGVLGIFRKLPVLI